MPIKYTKVVYGCQYKCGFIHRKKEKIVETHENICWLNPKNRTCKTCKYEDVYQDDNGVDIYGVEFPKLVARDCRGDGSELMETLYNVLEQNNIKDQLPPVINYPFWGNDEHPDSKLEDGLPFIPDYINKLSRPKQPCEDKEIPF